MAFRLFVSVLALGAMAAEPAPSRFTQRAIREAENLSLLKDRLLACTVLARTLKEARGTDAKTLKEKITQLSRYFYTDKGLQDYLVGKELFEKQKFSDALEKFSEADDLEKGNIDVLHYLALTQLWTKQGALAEVTNKKALQINPFDIEILRDQFAIHINNEKWPEALLVGKVLSTQHSDSSPVTLQELGLSLLQTGAKEEGKKFFLQAIAKDNALPEAYYGVVVISEQPNSESQKFISKYIDLCNSKAPRFVDRDPLSCSHFNEVKSLKETTAKAVKDIYKKSVL